MKQFLSIKFNLIFILVLNLIATNFIMVVGHKILTLDIYYPLENLVSVSDMSTIFEILISSACYSQQCPETLKQLPLPIWGFKNETYYVYNNTDYYHPNHWIKSISIPSDYIGNVYFQLIGHQNNDSHNAVYLCDSLFIYENQFCQQQGMPYLVNVTKDIHYYSATIYPSFGNIQGETITLLESLYSPQLDTTRNITLYTPNSMKQNKLKRNINVIILNDGSIEVLNSFVYNSGFDVAIQSGLVPESIMIGIPSNESVCQRLYELTYGPCNRTLTGTEPPAGCSYDPSCYGGNEKYFDFIEQTVVPKVLSTFNMNITNVNEVTMMGVSAGGLTSCNAVLVRPNYYKRALCMSPSMWFNYGEFSSLVKSKSTKLPVSVVMVLGTSEDGLYNNKIDPDTYLYWSDFIDNARKAWYDLGLGRDDDTSISKSNLAFFKLIGGLHNQVSWNNIFYEGIKLLYSTENNDNDNNNMINSYHNSGSTGRRLSLNQNFEYIFPNETCNIINQQEIISHNDNDDNNNENGLSTVEIILLVLLCVSVLVIIMLIIILRLYIIKNNELIEKSSLASAIQSNPMQENSIIL